MAADKSRPGGLGPWSMQFRRVQIPEAFGRFHIPNSRNFWDLSWARGGSDETVIA